jgi:cytochrome P450 monooxygenase
MASFTVLFLTCAFIVVFFYKCLNQIQYRLTLRRNGCKRPPGYPHKDPLFGIDLFYRYMSAFKAGNFLDFNTRMFDEQGKTFVAKQFGSTIIRTIDPEVSKAVHATYFANFGLQPLRYDVAKNLFGNGIIVVDGPHWQHGRALIRSSFDVAHISNFDRLHRFTEQLMNLLPNDGSTVDLMPLFRRLILDTSSEFILGEAMGALAESEDCTKFMEAFEYAQKGTAIRSMLGWFIFLHRDKKWQDACNHVTEFADRHVEKALTRTNKIQEESSSDGKGHESRRLRLVDEMAKDTQDRLTLRSHIISVFSPAHDGAAVTLSNALFHLSRNPGAVKKLRAEILPTRHELLNYDLLNSYKYLTWIFKESKHNVF